MRWRCVALSFAIVVTASACGSRLDDDELAKTNGGGGGGASAATTPSQGNTGVQNGAGGPKVGTLPLPCGKAPGGGAPKAPTQPADGVTANSIKIAVISDKSGQVKVPTASVEESMQAFVDFCNSFGGINGRRLELTKIDSKLFQPARGHQAGVQRQGVRHRGQRVGHRQPGCPADGRLWSHRGAGLHRHPGQGALGQSRATDTEPVRPLQRSGPPRVMVKTYPKAVKKAALLFGDIETATVQAQRIQKAYEAAGFNFVYVKKTGVIHETYTSEVEEMKGKGVQWVTMVSATVGGAEAAPRHGDPGLQARGHRPRPAVLRPRAPRRARAPRAPSCSSTPRRSRRSTGTRRCRSTTRRTRRSAPRSSTRRSGVQAFSAGLLFATAAKAAGDDLTRDGC